MHTAHRPTQTARPPARRESVQNMDTLPAAHRDTATRYMALFTEHSTDHATMQPHGVNQSTGKPYKKYVNHNDAPITRAIAADHLAGRITLATQPQRGGVGRWIIIDLDNGQCLQSSVDRLARLGLWAFAVTSHSTRADGTPAHIGGHVWIPVDEPMPAPALHAAGIALTTHLGLGTDEVWPRMNVDVRLPFGRNRRAQAGREWGALHLPNSEPMIISSGAHGFALFHAAYRPNSRAAVLAFVPQPSAAPSEAPRQHPAKRPDSTQRSTGYIAPTQIISDYNQHVDVRSVLESFGAVTSGPRRYRCNCGKHTAGQEDCLKVIEWDRPGSGVQTFGANCALYGTTHDAFSVMQHLGGYAMKAALDCARSALALPAFEPQHPAPRPHQRPVPAPPVVNAPDLVLYAAKDRAALDCSLPKSARRVLGVLLTKSAGQGWCKLTNRAMYLAADCCESTARTAVYTLRDHRYITIDTSGNAYGGSEANYYIFCDPFAPQKDTALQRAEIGGGVISLTPYNVLSTQYGGGDLHHTRKHQPAAPCDDREWESLCALAPSPQPDEESYLLPNDESPPRTAPLVVPASPTPAAGRTPNESQTETSPPSPPAAQAARPLPVFGPNAAALAILLDTPGYVEMKQEEAARPPIQSNRNNVSFSGRMSTTVDKFATAVPLRPVPEITHRAECESVASAAPERIRTAPRKPRRPMNLSAISMKGIPNDIPNDVPFMDMDAYLAALAPEGRDDNG